MPQHPVFIIGDAVFQTHFFSGTGLLAGFEMADEIANDLDEIAVAEKNAERKTRLTKRVHNKIQAIVDKYIADVEVIARTKPMDLAPS
jgi:2-polyprenyl-6-methoxyphenol hydroxylase-like FAD-dependent oxidoreductase